MPAGVPFALFDWYSKVIYPAIVDNASNLLTRSIALACATVVGHGMMTW